MENWLNIPSNIGWATRDIRSKFIHYKIIHSHRYHYTSVKLFRMGLVLEKGCWEKLEHYDMLFGNALWCYPFGKK